MKRLKSTTRFQLLATMGVLIVVSLFGATIAMPTGIMEEDAQGRGTTLDLGCHAPILSAEVQPILEGVPMRYAMMDSPVDEYEAREFTLNISVVGGHGTDRAGFNLWVTAGTLDVHPDEDEGRVRISDDATEATHSMQGDRGRNWTLVWTAPPQAGDGVLFRLMVQVIDPDQAPPSQTDQWNQVNFVSAGEDGSLLAPEHLDTLRVEEFGVGWFAYWVGIISFVFLGVILLVYYVVFRYGETSKATDHRTRKGKSK